MSLKLAVFSHFSFWLCFILSFSVFLSEQHWQLSLGLCAGLLLVVRTSERKRTVLIFEAKLSDFLISLERERENVSELTVESFTPEFIMLLIF